MSESFGLLRLKLIEGDLFTYGTLAASCFVLIALDHVFYLIKLDFASSAGTIVSALHVGVNEQLYKNYS